MEVVINDFTSFEIRFIQQHWENKSVQFIANMLDRPFKQVENKILDMNKTHKVQLYQNPTFERVIKKQAKEIKWAGQQLEDKKINIRVSSNEGLIPVMVDRRTTIYVKPGTDINKIKSKYSNNRL